MSQLQPIASLYAHCACGRIASFRLIVRVGANPKQHTIALCPICAALETGVAVAVLLAPASARPVTPQELPR